MDFIMPKFNKLPPHDYLLESFVYTPDIGVLIWKERPEHHFNTYQGFLSFNSRFPDTVAGALSGRGYIHVKVKDGRYRAHRLIWKMVTGEEPLDEIDHIDNDIANNRWNNLRQATHQENACNAPLSKRNSSGYKGCSFNEKYGLYQVDIQVNKVKHYLGRYASAEEAHQVYCDASTKLHKEFSNFG